MKGRMLFVTSFIIVGLFIAPMLFEARAEANRTDKKKAKHIIKLASIAPKGVGWSVIGDKLIADIYKKTNYEVYIDPYWGGIMGDDEDYITKMTIGQLDAGGFSGQGSLMVCPESSVVTLPFLFNDYDEVNYIKEKTRSIFDKIAANNGYKLTVWLDQDFDQFYSKKYELRRAEDFKKSKFLTWFGSLEAEVIRSLGGSPIPVNLPELPSYMRSGIGDSVIAPAILWVGTQLYTVSKYVNPILIRYSPGLIMISMRKWNELPPHHQKTLTDEFSRLELEFNIFSHDSNKKCLKAMLKYGLKEVKLTAKELETLRGRTRPLYDKMAGKEYPRKLLNEVLTNLRDFRAKDDKI
ncbi:MAG: TRAP transporter substrate-binding protein DctP [Thermodesulfobacteriota bacterium]|nr:TRAP transporter substrate-binding protein DctP [Thermodesulfobacteriota bacterium]